MTRTTIRNTLFALAALALVSAFASTPASAQRQVQLMSNILKADSDAKLAKPGTPKALATKQGPRAVTSIISGFNSRDRRLP
jgi:hypothetical protein